MSADAARHRPSLSGRIWRALIMAAALPVAYMAGAQSLGYALRERASEQAYRLAPWDAQVRARYARTLVTASPTLEGARRAEPLARQAIRAEGTAIDAVVTLGLTAQLRQDVPSARRFLGLAQRLSRRDLQAQLWGIEDAVARGDVLGALHHYDVALRTSRQARDLLYPILAGAVADPPVAAATAKVIADGPYWGPDFLYFLAKDRAHAPAAAALFSRLRAAKEPLPDGAEVMLTETLLATGDVERAWAFYAAIHPGADRRRSRDPRFAEDQGSRSSFDWQLFGDGGVYTSIERGTDGNVLTFSIAPGSAGLLARQMQLLPAGSYALSSRNSTLNLPERSRPAWELTCVGGPLLGRLPLVDSADRLDVPRGRFTVPASCPVQYLSLVARPHNQSDAVQGEVINVQLTPAD